MYRIYNLNLNKNRKCLSLKLLRKTPWCDQVNNSKMQQGQLQEKKFRETRAPLRNRKKKEKELLGVTTMQVKINKLIMIKPGLIAINHQWQGLVACKVMEIEIIIPLIKGRLEPKNSQG